MKGDFTRTTFDAKRHFNSVRMQQGRVQLDADWNEQLDIAAHRVETEARDLIGRCGGPLHDAGLGIAAAVGDLPAGQQAAAGALVFRPGDLYISAGRYYVDGILCENEQPVLATGQPDLPADAEIVRVGDNLVKLVPPPQAGVYLVYVDVWSRHLTAIEAPHILETALGGPDTCTRTKTVWQVKLLRAGNVDADINCTSEVAAWGQVTAKPTGQLNARAEPGAVATDPCIVAPGAGYRRLENQLYRVEVHKSGTLGNATFKWSRDNGSILTTWESKAGNDLTVGSIGRDKPLGFAAGQWIELTDDDREQLGQAGTLVQLVKAEGKVLTINPATATGPVDRALFKTNPKIRRWDSPGAVNIELPGGNQGFIPLEGGVEVKFSAGTYRSGDFWLIPARTATGDVEWPKDPANNAPIPQPPHGIDHHYCRLAVAQFDAGQWTVLSDCRELFPPVTELTSLHYVGGDGQEMTPSQSATVWLCGPLQVRVLNGGTPVEGAKVGFQIFEPHPAGSAMLATLDQAQQGTQLTVVTDSHGLAACRWRLDANNANVCQNVSATLLNRAGLPNLHQQVIFTARLDLLTAGEANLTRIVATSWKHGLYEADLLPIFEPVAGGQDKLIGEGFVIAFSDRVSVPRGNHDHVLEVLIPVPRTTTAAAGAGGGMPFTLVQPSAQSIYQCWCPLLTGYDAQTGRSLGKIVPVTCVSQGASIVRATLSSEPLANGVAFLLDTHSLTRQLINYSSHFDQFWIRLRCDFVLDQQLRAIDGEFLRAQFPTGDRPVGSLLGTQGGLFESWFSFRGDFRGGHMVPVLNGNELTVTAVSFWRKGKAAPPNPFVSVNGGAPQPMDVPEVVAVDETDPRFDVRVTTHMFELLLTSEQQTIDILWDGASRISHVPNVRLGTYSLRSRIVWDGGMGALNPISLDLRTVNRNVIRGQAFEASLNASSPRDLTLTYNQELDENMTGQPPGLSINPQTGLMTIDSNNTTRYRDNLFNPGGDYAFRGTVIASDGSFVKFEGMFDGIDADQG